MFPRYRYLFHMDSDELPSSLLTPRQREILKGDTDITARAQRGARARIRDRLHASIFDLHLIASTLPLADIDKALAEPDQYEAEAGTTPPLMNHLEALPALLYLHHREHETEAPSREDGWRTAIFVESGIEMALTRMGIGFESINVDIQVKRAEELDSLMGEEVKDLSQEQLSQLHRARIIDADTFGKALMLINQDDPPNKTLEKIDEE